MIKTYKIFILTFLVFLYHSAYCQKPKIINEAIAYFENNWTTTEKNVFKNKPETDAVSELHFSTGMWIRNEWIRGFRDTLLVKQFNEMGIYHPDDMSSIILTSVYRKLNNHPLDIDGLVEHYKSYWKPIVEYNQKTWQLAVENYNKHSIGDRIKIFMSVDTSDGQRNAVIVNSTKREWTFDPKKDLVIQGIITNKYFLNDSLNVFFSVKILSMNFENTTILMREVKPNDIFDFHLDKLRIE